VPFAASLQPIYEVHLKAVAKSLSLTISRGDDISGTNAVIDDIWSSITSARIVVADFSKRNPNVFYEVGVAHTLGRPTVLLSQDIDDVPFNLRHIRTVVYSPTAEGLAAMEEAARSSIITELGLG
jgi:hypothetical protein